MREAGVTQLKDSPPPALKTVRGAIAKVHRPRAAYATHARLATQALDHLPLAVAVIDHTLRLHYWNQNAAGLFGMPSVLAAEAPALLDLLQAAGRGTPRQRERIAEFCTEIIAAGDRGEPPAWLRLSFNRQERMAIRLLGIGANRWLLLIEPVNQHLQVAPGTADAMVDALTGLGNRRHFQETLRDVILHAGLDTRHAVLLIDLDRFKSINDTLGHPSGDALLCLAAQRLRRETREEDLIARLGGDEFAILMPDGDTAEALAGRLVSALSRPFLVDGHVANIGASIGIARYQDRPATAEDLMRQADLALFTAKSAGRRTWRSFEPVMAESARARRDLEADLRKAMVQGELSLAYQPQLNVRTRTLTGFEALLRWNHPTRGAVSPAVFIPIAEAIGCILEIGEWVLLNACRQATAWPDGLTVAVNVSFCQFGDCERLFRAVQTALQTTGLAPGRLEIEITESALMTQEAPVLDLMHRLRALGIRLAMDDFGTGYSSLSQLRTFPFDKIKIDQSFVANLGQNEQASAIMRAITSLGSGLGMTTIAEGVETVEQAALVEADGCTEIQGYLISRPIPATEIDALLLRYMRSRTAS